MIFKDLQSNVRTIFKSSKNEEQKLEITLINLQIFKESAEMCRFEFENL